MGHSVSTKLISGDYKLICTGEGWEWDFYILCVLGMVGGGDQMSGHLAASRLNIRPRHDDCCLGDPNSSSLTFTTTELRDFQNI